LPKAKEESVRRSAYRLEFVTQGSVSFPDSGDEHNTVVVERESRVQHDTNVVKKIDHIKSVVGRCWEECHHSSGEVRAVVVLGWGFEECQHFTLEK